MFLIDSINRIRNFRFQSQKFQKRGSSRREEIRAADPEESVEDTYDRGQDRSYGGRDRCYDGQDRRYDGQDQLYSYNGPEEVSLIYSPISSVGSSSAESPPPLVLPLNRSITSKPKHPQRQQHHDHPKPKPKKSKPKPNPNPTLPPVSIANQPRPPPISITIHPLLAYDQHPSIHWEVIQSPLLAHLSPYLPDSSLTPEYYHWKSLPALHPRTTTYITIRFDPLDEYITVYPKPNSNSNIGNGYVTIGDILCAVYMESRRQATVKYLTSLGLDMNVVLAQLPRPVLGPGPGPGAGSTSTSTSAPGLPSNIPGLVMNSNDLASPPSTPEFTQFDHQDAAASNVRGILEYRTHWAGLTPSRYEPDLWVCHTRASSP